MSLCDNVSKEMQPWGAICPTAWGRQCYVVSLVMPSWTAAFPSSTTPEHGGLNQCAPLGPHASSLACPDMMKNACMGELLAAYKAARVCMSYKCPVLWHPRGQSLLELHTVSKSIAPSSWSASDGTFVLPIFGRHFPCFPDWEVLGGW